MVLTPDELAELTARTRPRAQAEVLQALGIPYRTRPDGTLVVLRAVAAAVLGEPAKQRGPRLRLPA